MKLRAWEIAAGFVGVAFALIFLFSNAWGIGVGLLCADALWLLTRIEIVEKTGRPGRYASVRGRLGHGEGAPPHRRLRSRHLRRGHRAEGRPEVTHRRRRERRARGPRVHAARRAE